MLSAEQIKQLISANESLRVQLADANAMLVAREQEIEFLGNELTESVALRSKIDGQQDEMESMRNILVEKQHATKGAEEREHELQRELSEMAVLNKEYNELLQDYASLQSQFNDLQIQLMDLKQGNMLLQQASDSIGELQSRLENTLLERDVLKEHIELLEMQKRIKLI